MKKYSFKFLTIVYIVAIAGVIAGVNACSRHKPVAQASQSELKGNEQHNALAAQPMQQNVPQHKMVSIVQIEALTDGTTGVIFKELAEPFVVTDATAVAALKSAYETKVPVNITFDPWKGVIMQASLTTDNERNANASSHATSSRIYSRQVDMSKINGDELNTPEALGILNTTTTGLTNVIPDMATAQLIFDYITHQCCAVPGPYTIDHCISFQYCQDGCYARAHKMCWILNNKYHYETHKIFSFAYPSGTYTLSVQAQKWGGCCIRWWYHVAPLVNIKTPTGIKAYVFDPAMFDQPVLLATWLHAQENPACMGGKIPKVTSINIQPTSSFWPNDTSSFDPDPTFSYTNSTLISYGPLKTCP